MALCRLYGVHATIRQVSAPSIPPAPCEECHPQTDMRGGRRLLARRSFWARPRRTAAHKREEVGGGGRIGLAFLPPRRRSCFAQGRELRLPARPRRGRPCCGSRRRNFTMAYSQGDLPPPPPPPPRIPPSTGLGVLPADALELRRAGKEDDLCGRWLRKSRARSGEGIE